MSCESEIHVGDLNTRLIVSVSEACAEANISTASAITILITKPSGIVMTKTATFLTTGSDGDIYWDSVAGDFDEIGYYKIQGRVVIGGGTYSTSVSSFRVFGNLA